jgi:type IV secretory pathway TrbL component
MRIAQTAIAHQGFMKPSFAQARAQSADAHGLAMIAAALVAATAIAFLAMVFTAWPSQASTLPCGERLAAVETEMHRSLTAAESLGDATAADHCTAAKAHLASLTLATGAIDACTSGAERTAKIGLLRQSRMEWQGVVAHGCR